MRYLILSVFLTCFVFAEEYGFMECPYHISEKYYISNGYIKGDIEKVSLPNDKMLECFKRADNNLDEYISYNFGIFPPANLEQQKKFTNFVKNNLKIRKGD